MGGAAEGEEGVLCLAVKCLIFDQQGEQTQKEGKGE